MSMKTIAKGLVPIFVNFYIPERWYSKYVIEKPGIMSKAQLRFGCLDPEAVGRFRHIPKR